MHLPIPNIALAVLFFCSVFPRASVRAEEIQTHVHGHQSKDTFIIPASAFRDAHNYDPLRDPSLDRWSVNPNSPVAIAEWMQREQRRRFRMGAGGPASGKVRAYAKPPFFPGTYFGLLENQASVSAHEENRLSASAKSALKNRLSVSAKSALNVHSSATATASVELAMKRNDKPDEPVYIYPISPDSP